MVDDEDIQKELLTFDNPMYYETVYSIVKKAESFHTGTLGKATEHSDGEYNTNSNVLRSIYAKALLYSLFKVKLYGIEAIKMIKEYISSLDIVTENDQCRYYGETMYNAAVVYDWCYDLMDDEDKESIICGVERYLCDTSNEYGKSMEVGFFPDGQGAVSGHGSERQILRDYLSFAIAIYDEDPTWYNFIAGRIYEEYVPVRNEYYKANYVPQGISLYLNIRFTSDLWSAWLLETATGVNPYNSNMQNVMHSVFAHIVNGEYVIFDEGDDKQNSDKAKMVNFAEPALFAAHIFDDTLSGAFAEFFEYSNVDSNHFWIAISGNSEPDDYRFENLDLITYNGGFAEQIITHDSWDSDAASAFMKIGERSGSNHDHADAGTFQIYYKGLLTGDSGVYDSYNSTNHKTYTKTTVAHNGVVIYRKNGKGEYEVYGENLPGEASTLEQWKKGKYKYGNVTGKEYAYDKVGNPLYAYIAGNIKNAYFSTGIARADRRMITIYDTGDDGAVMYFFVYDNYTTSQEGDIPTFLLHAQKAPTIEGNTVTLYSDGGKLVLENVFGGENIVEIGGKDKNYMVNGKQQTTTSGSRSDNMWGRVEISPSEPQQNNIMLNVMYVTDKKSDLSLNATAFSNEVVHGSVIGNTACVFVDSHEKRTNAFTFDTKTEGTINYYVSGVSDGTWEVLDSSGNVIKTASVSSSSGLLTFTANGGKIVIRPKN